MERIEKKVADTLLERGEKIILEGNEYEIAPPTIATMVLVSEKISEFPVIETDFDNGEDLLFSMLSNAKDCGLVADIAAILILGAKEYKKAINVSRIARIFGRSESKFDKIRNAVLNSSPQTLDKIVGIAGKGMQVGDFFSVITFLNKVNLTKQTKSKTTQSGQ
ncbi:MAG: hypothetical protein J5588_06025 [Bacteroidales bacterium]|nr:hypothetical protein [Bacteroidales bacterium]